MGRDAPGDAAARGVHRGGRGGHGAGVLRPPAADRGAGPAASQHHQPGSGDRVCGRPGAPYGQGRRRDLVWRRQARRRPDPAQIAGPLAPARRTRPPLGSGAASFRSPRHAPEQGHNGGPAGTGRGGVFAQLRESGMLVRVRFSETDPGQVTGYAVTLPGHTGPDGAPRWYGAAATPARPSRHHGTNIRLPVSANWDAASPSRACARVWPPSAKSRWPIMVSDMAKLQRSWYRRFTARPSSSTALAPATLPRFSSGRGSTRPGGSMPSAGVPGADAGRGAASSSPRCSWSAPSASASSVTVPRRGVRAGSRSRSLTALGLSPGRSARAS
jgi:hypothetical protein